MAQIPGNEIFPEQKRNYGSDNIVYVEISIDTGNDDYGNGAGYSAWFKPGNARAVFWVSTLGNIVAKMRPYGSETPSEWREMYLAGQISKATDVKVGIISGEVMPHEFILNTDNASASAITVYFVY